MTPTPEQAALLEWWQRWIIAINERDEARADVQRLTSLLKGAT